MGRKLKELLANQKLVKVLGIGQLCHPKVVEIVGLGGEFAAVWLDHEHAGISIAQMEQAALAARATGMDSFTRLYATDYATVMRPLEAGVGGIMAAQVRTAEEVERLVSWVKFHPLGMRGVNGTGADGRFGTIPIADYFRRANEETFVAVQIEHSDAVGVVDRIASVPGVDLLFIGPADLSQSMNIPGQWDHPDLWNAFEAVASASAKHNVPWAILPLNPSFAKRCVDLDCRMLSISMDVWVFQRGLKTILQEYSF